MQKIKTAFILLLCACMLSGCGASRGAMAENRTVEIYYIDSDMLRLIPIETPIKKMSAQKSAEWVVNKLIEGSDSNKKIRRLIPNEKNCITVKVEHETAVVDLSESMINAPFEGRDLEVLAVYQIVNSVTSVEGISTVKFTINGEQKEDFKGFLNMRETFIPDYML